MLRKQKTSRFAELLSFEKNSSKIPLHVVALRGAFRALRGRPATT